jgi:predicted MFS family arabinose efflux permease
MDIGIASGALLLGIVGEVWGFETMFIVAGVVVVLGLLLFSGFSRPRPD